MAEPIEIFTDGACKGNPGPGGWGALIVEGGDERELFGGEPQTTNNRMELLAVIRALEAVDEQRLLKVFTDSQYVQKGITEWVINWQRRGWKTASKQPVKNADLWKTLVALSDARSVEWHWVRGHNGHPGNERADELANRGVSNA
ncbi:MAG: ribonuclease HI [Burkholderiaceae bacterium]